MSAPVVRLQQIPLHRHRSVSIILLWIFSILQLNLSLRFFNMSRSGGISQSQHSDATSDRLQAQEQFLAHNLFLAWRLTGLTGRLTVQAVGSPALADAP